MRRPSLSFSQQIPIKNQQPLSCCHVAECKKDQNRLLIFKTSIIWRREWEWMARLTEEWVHYSLVWWQTSSRRDLFLDSHIPTSLLSHPTSHHIFITPPKKHLQSPHSRLLCSCHCNHSTFRSEMVNKWRKPTSSLSINMPSTILDWVKNSHNKSAVGTSPPPPLKIACRFILEAFPSFFNFP